MGALLGEYEPLPGSTSRLQRYKNLLFIFFAGLIIGSLVIFKFLYFPSSLPPLGTEFKCKKIQALSPSFNKSINLILTDPYFKQQSIKRFSGALQIPTEIQDVNPSPKDNLEYYKEFFTFHRFLEKEFPLVHSHLSLEKVNEVGLLYTWHGSDATLKPMMLTAHQDVVPVNKDTWDDWTYPPFSGVYDVESDIIWGRGAFDCKNLLISELEAIEQLLKDEFKPKRTVLIVLGFDEESSGLLGAKSLSEVLYKRYGENGIYSIVDEGGPIVELEEGLYIATPITGEKGYVDLEYTIHGHGGHSSMPPDHTTIGIASELINLLESNPFPFNFEFDNPFYGLLTCSAEHSLKLPSEFKDAILTAPFNDNSKRIMMDYISKDESSKEFLRTSQAVDIIRGGIKANALPESTYFLINHRVDLTSSVNQTILKDLEHTKTIARKYGYGITLDSDIIIPATGNGFIEIVSKKSLEPAPITPVVDSPVWDILSGTIQDVFENGVLKDYNNTELYITTSLFSGNTDTKYYWGLTKHIYRFMAMITPDYMMSTIHSVNEHAPMSTHLSSIAFIYEYIVNVNEYA